MRYQDFVSKAQRIYQDSFRTSRQLVRSTGVVCDDVYQRQSAGVGVVVRYPVEAVAPLLRFALRIADCTTADITGEHIHTSLKMSEAVDLMQNSHRRQYILTELAEQINTLVPVLSPFTRRQCLVTCESALYNQSSVIIPTTPSKAFYDLVQQVGKVCRNILPTNEDPWGAHITLARFTQATPANKLTEFFKLMESSPPVTSIWPNRIDIIYYQVKESTVHFSTYQSIPL